MEYKIDKSWTLFLDRDGVINEKLENDYVKNWSEFSFIKGTFEALSTLSSLFGTIIVVTNQRGVGKGIMTLDDLNLIHFRMLECITKNFGKVDGIYFCSDVLDTSECRKPNIGMANQAKIDFPWIDFSKSVMIGDSRSDIEFGQRLGMKTVYISNEPNSSLSDINVNSKIFKSLKDFTSTLVSLQ